MELIKVHSVASSRLTTEHSVTAIFVLLLTNGYDSSSSCGHSTAAPRSVLGYFYAVLLRIEQRVNDRREVILNRWRTVNGGKVICRPLAAE
jgi:hypothetical protein